MFGKDDPNLTEEDVGNYVKQLAETTPDPLAELLAEAENNEELIMVRPRKKPTSGTLNKV